MNSSVSIIIPAKNEKYLEATVRNILENAEGEIEIIVELDGWVPDPKINMHDERVLWVHHEVGIGQRACINHAAGMAKGDFIMKLDAHCAVDKGFDVKLVEDCEYEWTVVPRMYNLDVETWKPKLHKVTDYMFMSSPTEKKPFRAQYYTGKEYRRQQAKPDLIDDTMCCMGPGWFMHKARFFEQGGCDEGHEGGWGQQGIEVACKAWLSGGALKVNKKTWFAHWFRGGGGPGFPYEISGKQVERVRKYSRDLWLNDKWEKATRKFEWLVEKFNPPTWSKEMKVSPGRKMPGHKQWGWIGSTIMEVEDLWTRRDEFCDPRKRDSLRRFKESFPSYAQAIHEGKVFTDEELEKLPYFDYLLSKLHKLDRIPVLTRKGKRHAMHLMKEVRTLYDDIKLNGLKNPLDMWREGEGLVLNRGGRRLELLYVLGVKKIPIRIFKSKKAYRLYAPPKEITEDESIHGLAMKQFQELKERATDKYWVHSYTRLYDQFLGYMRPTASKILEIGVFRGASLLLWEQAFPNAAIYGVDKHFHIWQRYLAGRERVKVFVGRQEDIPFLQEKVIPAGPYDIIIDDGGHRPEPTQASFRTLWASVAKGGWYVIEDLFGDYRWGKSESTTMHMLKKLIDEMSLGDEVLSIHFYYNICFIQKR